MTSGNRFLTVERLHNRENIARQKLMKGVKSKESIMDYYGYISNHIRVEKFKPRSMMKLDEDIMEAMRKMKMIHDLILFLPQIDCGTCGSPSCSALAEDIVQGRASLAQCHFVQRTLEDRKLFTREESVKTLEDTWSSDKFNRKWLLNL